MMQTSIQPETRPRLRVWGKTLADIIIGGLRVALTLPLSPLLRRWYNRWGATDEEVAHSLPGDDLVAHARHGYTRAITIHAPARQVWPWLVQPGQQRGGWYSYDGLENLAGCHIHTTDRIVAAWQNPQPGDLLRLGPEGYPCMEVQRIEPERAFILRGADLKTGQPIDRRQPLPHNDAVTTWQFVLDAQDKQTTRLIVRQRLDYSPDQWLLWRIVEPINFVMEQKMLRTIKQRAEALASA
jgi:hypothetical protein